MAAAAISLIILGRKFQEKDNEVEALKKSGKEIMLLSAAQKILEKVKALEKVVGNGNVKGEKQ